MEVGIEDCLHIEFEYNKAKWVLVCLISALYPVLPLFLHDIEGIPSHLKTTQSTLFSRFPPPSRATDVEHSPQETAKAACSS